MLCSSFFVPRDCLNFLSRSKHVIDLLGTLAFAKHCTNRLAVDANQMRLLSHSNIGLTTSETIAQTYSVYATACRSWPPECHTVPHLKVRNQISGSRHGSTFALPFLLLFLLLPLTPIPLLQGPHTSLTNLRILCVETFDFFGIDDRAQLYPLGSALLRRHPSVAFLGFVITISSADYDWKRSRGCLVWKLWVLWESRIELLL